MKQILSGIAIGTLVSAASFGLYIALFADGGVLPDTPAVRSERSRPSAGVMDLICELKLDNKGLVELGISINEPAHVVIAQIDFDKFSGWYQGTLAIAEGRAGSLSVQGKRLKVSRPAMFQRFGVTITGEEFVVDRSNGDFESSISLKDGRNVTLIRGSCAAVDKPPF